MYAIRSYYGPAAEGAVCHATDDFHQGFREHLPEVVEAIVASCLGGCDPSQQGDCGADAFCLAISPTNGVCLATCQADACHKANPDNHVRLVGYDNYAQSQGTAMVIYRGPIKV